MDSILGLATLATLLLAGYFLSRLFRPDRFAESALAVFCAVTALIPSLGYGLSALRLLDSLPAWFFAGLAALSLILAALAAIPPLRRLAFGRKREPAESGKEWWRALPLADRAVLALLAVTALLCGALNLADVVFTAPHIWDNMVYRLPRVAYWLQQGHCGYFDATLSTQVLVQKNFELILSFVFMVSGKNENLSQSVQFISYWFGAVAIFGIARRLGAAKASGVFAALVYLLLPQVLLQASTANNDLLICAYLGSLVYALLSYRATGARRYLALAGGLLGLLAGTKASMVLALPSLALILACSFSPWARKRRVDFLLFVGWAALGLLLFALPAGYLENWRIFGHPFGNEEFRKLNVAEGKPLPLVFRNTLKHLSAQALDFLSLDGLPPAPPVRAVQRVLQYLPRRGLAALGWSPESDPADTWYYDKPWYFDKPPVSHPDYSLWGVLGFALVWPGAAVALFGRRRPAAARALAAGALLFVAVHSASGASWGHYTIYAAAFAVPLSAAFFPPRGGPGRIYLAAVSALGCLSALSALLFQYRSPLIVDQAVWLRDALGPRWAELMPLPHRTDSIFRRDRLDQLLRDGPVFAAPVRKFDELVPARAVVAICLNPHSYEYPLFGEKLSRRIIPINSFHTGLRPIPPEAEFLLWADDFDGVFQRRVSDVHLGKDWYLRKLK